MEHPPSRDLVASLLAVVALGCGAADESLDEPLGSESQALDFLDPGDTGGGDTVFDFPQPCLSAASCERTLAVGGKNVRYFGSYGLGSSNPNVQHAVIMVHGVNRNAGQYFDTLVASANMAQTSGYNPGATVDTILLAPHFPNQTDNRPADYHHWQDDGWVAGNDSCVSPKISSYAVVDAMIDALTAPGRFPALASITVAGHSAGAQLTHRYAAANGKDGSLPNSIILRYVVANPSSYLYVNGARPKYDGSPGFGVPYTYQCSFGGLGGYSCSWKKNAGFGSAPSCPTSYDDYRYGLADLYGYAGAVGATTLRSRLLDRSVIVLLGTADTDPADPNLDTSCPAALQGPNRFVRGHRQLDFLNAYYPGHGHGLVEVPGAGHNSGQMFVQSPTGSDIGSAVLFFEW